MLPHSDKQRLPILCYVYAFSREHAITAILDPFGVGEGHQIPQIIPRQSFE
ncbi:hypothetical protein CEV34_0038 [Brucella pseudogrignonensis]|uniref:Uncharacterized protein n=1 Tax=Brucella pseudogrignonensis TaxID=419475 RepID=A0A256GUT1_9HYPH|nr:hypothetical protein CEV34_0038 [Brucella pseudogrignonensis]